MPKLVLCALACWFVSAAGLSQAEVYKCLDDQGRVSYGQSPCKGQKQLPYEAGSVTTIEGIKPTPTPVPTPTPEPAPVAQRPTPAQQQPAPDPDMPAGDNCNLDNPAYDPVFCTPNNLRALYGPPPLPRPGQRLTP